MSSQHFDNPVFQPFSVLYFVDGFELRQLSTFPEEPLQSKFINYIVKLGAKRAGDWYKFPVGGKTNFDEAIQKTKEVKGEVYNLPPWPLS
jgi:hypothetical protein